MNATMRGRGVGVSCRYERVFVPKTVVGAKRSTFKISLLAVRLRRLSSHQLARDLALATFASILRHHTQGRGVQRVG
jgi:hypothetical protein